MVNKTGRKSCCGAMEILIVMVFVFSLVVECEQKLPKRAYLDDSIPEYSSERTCWWNEVCKREFQYKFRCRCPRWSFCRSPGKYYDAYCSITSTGYIWVQAYQKTPKRA